MSGPQVEAYRPKATTPTEIKKVVGRASLMLVQARMILATAQAAMAITDADAHDLAARTGHPVRYSQDVLHDELAALSGALNGLADQLAVVPVPAGAAPSPAPRMGNPARDYQAEARA